MLNVKEYYEKCWYCQCFYGENYGEPVCSTCHYFLFPDIIDDVDDISNRHQTEEKLESNDSGNEDSVDGFDQQFSINNNPTSSSSLTSSSNSNRRTLTNYLNINNKDNKPTINIIEINNETDLKGFTDNQQNLVKNNIIGVTIANSNYDLLTERINSLTNYKQKDVSSFINIESVPIEVLLKIFRNLDDFSLWSVSLVCKKWNELIKTETSEHEWKSYVNKRWILYKPAVKVSCWKNIYSQLVESSNCLYCLRNIYNKSKVTQIKEFQTSWRHRRLLLELKALQQDPPDGINAKPLDSSCFYWQAAITGPHGSPYEGGIFYLFLQIPQSYPLKPPLVRFITKIYHPNISRHGDIGLDSIHENWSLALTISKVLISIQSLLTDPYTKVCMEEEIGELYNTNIVMYEKKAKFYTWKYAMNDYIEFNLSDSKIFNIKESTD